ncbi:MAG: CDP-glycerol glycerophosphotransferase family protein, partial [Desulfobacterota bacterium]|nr:CDP-glycerol glycerophosphotransferase family protein [Thermodesulfobacteriota bacterium]
MKAVLLAAGRGRRLGERTESEPKCMITVGPRRLIDYQLQCLEALHIRDIIVVVGYKADVLKHYIQAAFPRLVVSFVENPDFSTTNTAYSLWLAKDHIIDADFVYCNADVLFHAEILRRLLYSPEKNILAVQRTTTEDEEVKVMVQGSRIIAIGKDVPKEMAYGEFIGIGKFSKYAAPLFMEKLRQVINGQEGRMQYFEAALQMLCPLQKIAALDVTDLPSIEIDFPEDLQRAEQHIIHKIARTKKRRHRPRILFYAERNLHLPFLEPLHDYIAEHYDADLAFSAPPYRISQGGMTGCGLSKDDIQRLRAKSVFYENPLAFQADIAVVADACFYHVRHCKKIVNVGHGLICKGWFYTDDPVVRRENRADLICVPGQWHKEILEKNVSTPLVVTGFIKSDALFHCTQYDVKRFKEKYGIDEYTKTILFAPTFNEELSALPYVYDRIHELCDQHTVILIKLHGMTDKAWVDRYRSIATTTAGIKLIDDVHIACAMRCADVMVSDVSSIAAEFMLLDKPVVFFNNPRQKEYCRYRPGDIEYVIRDAGIQAATFDELKLGITLA